MKFRNLTEFVSVSVVVACAFVTQAVAQSTLRLVPNADLKILDPIWTTAYISRNHGYLVYDTLFALDAKGQPQPQMVENWSVSQDQLAWTFTLRDGLKFHDGTVVTAADVVASLRRWGARDGMGQQLMAAIEQMPIVDDKTFKFELKFPYGLVLESIGKSSSNVPFIMPKSIAETDPFKQIEDYTGSGPFVFAKDEWRPGAKVVYRKFTGYVPRKEAPNGLAGGKVAKVDRIEWLNLPDQTTALNALASGEVDFLEAPSPDLLPILSSTKGVVVAPRDPVGSVGILRFNHLLPPFDNANVRRAVLLALRQEDFLLGGVGDEQYWRTCYSAYACGTPLASDEGADVLKAANIDRARTALRDAGYDGTPVVIMNPTDQVPLAAWSTILADTLRKIGMKVDLQSMDWATLTARRAKKETVAHGGWNIFVTHFRGVDVSDPTSILFSGDAAKGYFGWPNDAQLEKLRREFSMATSVEGRTKIAVAVQRRVLSEATQGYLGQFFAPVAYRSSVKGVLNSSADVYWNVFIER